MSGVAERVKPGVLDVDSGVSIGLAQDVALHMTCIRSWLGEARRDCRFAAGPGGKRMAELRLGNAFGKSWLTIWERPASNGMNATTTLSVAGIGIAADHRIVTREAILVSDVFRDVFGWITDIIDDRCGANMKSVGKARDTALI